MITVAYSPKYLDWNLGVDHPTNPIRASLAVALLEHSGVDLQMLDPDEYYPMEFYFDQARKVHNSAYVTRIQSGVCGEWDGVNPLLGETAALMFGGTVVLTERLISSPDRRRVWFNPQGAKHHAQYDHSSGFCVFNDMAWAAERLTEMGERVVYLDWDAHHGDGVENLLRSRIDITTISVHDSTVFPGTGFHHGEGFYNYPMEHGAGDLDLLDVMGEIKATLLEIKPTVILLACGADGLAGDPLSNLLYTQEGLDHASRMVGSVARRLGSDVLIGGAGGYQPYDEVPEHWSRCVSTIDKWLNI